uniref:Uncharacterized protein n=1 Tax=Moorena producens (strain JHB) TaxID=1454205 RepID=A0A1D9G416_MOOP1
MGQWRTNKTLKLRPDWLIALFIALRIQMFDIPKLRNVSNRLLADLRTCGLADLRVALYIPFSESQ